MERSKCGKSGYELSVLGLGCWSFGGGDYWGPQEERDVVALVNMALDSGINYFDTAEGYNEGRSEESLGRALKGRRHEAVIGTKVHPGMTDPAVLRCHCEASLRRLQTDYIDIYMFHWPLFGLPMADAFATMTELQAEGKIRSIGVSNFGVQQLDEAIVTGARIDVDELCYNLLSRAIEAEILPMCIQHDIGVVGYMPLMQGLLTGKYRTADEVPPVRACSRHFRPDRPGSVHGEDGAEDEVFRAIEGIAKIAQAEGVPMSHVALAWAAARLGITLVLAGARNTEQLQDNIRAISLHLSPEVIVQLDELTEPILHKLGTNPDYYMSRERSRIC